MSARTPFRTSYPAFLAGLILIGLAMSDAQACSCGPNGTVQEEFAGSSAVFRGTVLQVATSDADAFYSRNVTFQVSQVWKGPAESLATIRTSDNSAACGYPFAVGQEYVVYVEPGSSVWLCTRTRLRSDAAADLAALGAGQIPGSAPLERLIRHAYVAGAWYNPQRSGEGFLVEVLDDGRGVAYWFGYRADDASRQSWLVGTGTFQGNTLLVPEVLQPVGGGFGNAFNPAAVNHVVWGELRLQFGFDGRGSVRWSSVLPGYGSGEFALQRLTRPPLAPLVPAP